MSIEIIFFPKVCELHITIRDIVPEKSEIRLIRGVVDPISIHFLSLTSHVSSN